MLVRKYVFLQVHLHEVEQLEEQLTDAQIFADHLALGLWEEVLQLGILLRAILDESLYLSDLEGDLHHPQVTYLLCSLNCTVLEVFPQPYDH